MCIIRHTPEGRPEIAHAPLLRVRLQHGPRANERPVQRGDAACHSRPGRASLRHQQRGVATVVSDPLLSVHGLLWSLTEQHESDLDEYEGVAEGVYRKEKRSVLAASGQRVEALIYVAADCTEGPPQPGYFDRIVAAAARLAFPPEYQRELGKWLPK